MISASTPPWAGVIPAEELALYSEIGLGSASAKPGRAALLVIDVQYRSTGHQSQPISDAIREYPTSCGEFAWRAIPNIKALIDEFRRLDYPVFYPYVAPKRAHDGGRWADKAPVVMSVPAKGYDFVREVAPIDSDILVPKMHASAFFATPLLSYLVDKGITSVFVVGTTTSGCVRASVVDATSYGFRAVVPYDAVFDRSQTSHAVNLFDMNSKYADVVSTEEALRLISNSAEAAPSREPR